MCIMKYNFFLCYKGCSVVCNVSSLIIMFKTCKLLAVCCKKKNEKKYIKKSEFQMFSPISGRHVFAPQRDTNMASPY